MKRFVFVVSLVAALALSACGSSQQNATPAGTPAPQGNAQGTPSPMGTQVLGTTREPGVTVGATGTAPSGNEPPPGTPPQGNATGTPAAGGPNLGQLTANGTVAEPVPQAPAKIGLQQIAGGLVAPVYMTTAPDGGGRLFIVDQVGVIRIVDKSGKLLEQPFLDIRDKIVPLEPAYDERGLLSIAFHPDFKNNGRFFVHYNSPLRQGAPAGYDSTVNIAEFHVSKGDANKADPGSEKILLQMDKPQYNHNGGTVAFGPDGYLYISIGDGGGANDVGPGHDPATGNAQSTKVLLGKILRIDVNSAGNGKPYGIPKDNPFADGQKGLPEIFAYGFRNPYRFSFDMGGSNQIYAADAGQNLFEEVNIVTNGGDYGWHIKEGTFCFDPAHANQPGASCAGTGPNGERLIDPIIQHLNEHHPGGLGVVIVGGYVYRGSALPEFAGQYIFGNWSTTRGQTPDGRLFVSPDQNQPGKQLRPIQELLLSDSPDGKLHHFVLGFGQDDKGEVYVLVTDATGPSGNTGQVLKIVPAGGSGSTGVAGTTAPTGTAPAGTPAALTPTP